MASPNGTPKKATPRKGTSARGIPSKVTPNKSTPKKTKARSNVTVADLSAKSTETITFLWTALQHELQKNNGAVDYKAVADALGITKVAAHFRFYRIRDAFANDAEQAQGHEQENGGEDRPRKQPKSPKAKKEADSKVKQEAEFKVLTVKKEEDSKESLVKNEEGLDVKMEDGDFEI